jgi:hypothetical protein
MSSIISQGSQTQNTCPYEATVIFEIKVDADATSKLSPGTNVLRAGLAPSRVPFELKACGYPQA